MMVPLAVIGGIFFVAYGISRIKVMRERKPDVQTLFGAK